MNKKIPLCDCQNKHQSLSYMIEVESSDKQTCDLCGHYVFWGTKNDTLNENKSIAKTIYDDEFKEKVKKHYYESCSRNITAKHFNISPSSVQKWSHQHGWSTKRDDNKAFSREQIEEFEDVYYKTFSFPKAAKELNINVEILRGFAKEYKWVTKSLNEEYKELFLQIYKEIGDLKVSLKKIKKIKFYTPHPDTARKWINEYNKIHSKNIKKSISKQKELRSNYKKYLSDIEKRDLKIKKKYFEGMSLKDISKELNLSYATVASVRSKNKWNLFKDKNFIENLKHELNLYGVTKLAKRRNVTRKTIYNWIEKCGLSKG